METYRLYGVDYSVINLSKEHTTYTQLTELLKTKNIMIRVDTTKTLNEGVLKNLMNLPNSHRLRIRIVGGYDDDKIRNYGKAAYKEDNIYTPQELIKIIKEFEIIEKGLNPSWDDFQKVMYFVGYLREKMIYHPFHEIAPSKDIRSLLGICSGKTVCAGYSLILKELCDRNGIECHYVTGAVNEEDYKKGITTHAWNIVKINGVYVPLDLTWNAGHRNRGKIDSIEDLFNVNEFIKQHIPGRYEKIQDYKNNLRSVNGTFVRTINGVVNRDMTYGKNRTFYSTRKDGSRFTTVAIGSFVQNNKLVHRYLYRDVLSDGSFGKPIILYSTSNLIEIVSLKQAYEKIRWKIKEALKTGDKKTAKELEEKIKPEVIQHVYDADVLTDDLVFSKENIVAAIRRGDYFLGGVDFTYKPNGILKAETVSVDIDFGKDIGLRQKTCRRSDGTYFVLEDYGKMKFSNNRIINRYRIYELSSVNQEKVAIKNTVFSEEDLMTDNRQDLYDVFLARDRIDRKRKEAGGYLGYYSREGVKTYDPGFNKYFRDDLTQRMHLDVSKFKQFYETITMAEMKRLIKTYKKYNDNGRIIYVNRASRTELTDSYLLPRVKFAYIWLSAAGLKHTDGELEYGLENAFNNESEKLFNVISDKITKSMNRNGNVDPVKILMDIRNEAAFPSGPMTVVRLFNSEDSARLINTLYRLQNPSALGELGTIDYFYGGKMFIAETMINERRNQEAKRRILQVLKNQLGKVEIKSKNPTK